MGGRALVVDVVPGRRGRAYDPKVLDGFLEHAWGLLDERESQPNWGAVIAADPLPRALMGPRLEEALRCLGVFSDMKSTYTHGYSQAVADLARRAGAGALNDEEMGALGAAALVQELGMTGVSNAVLEKEGALTESEWERVRLHPYLTDRILARCAGLSAVRSLAAAHHERMDGGGYHRGTTGPQLTPAARLLAAAGVYVAMTSKRSWRPAMSRREAVAALRELAASGGLGVEAVDGVLAAAGEPVAPRRRTWPGGLTDREVEVLQLISQGRSNRQVAAGLTISAKTVGRHIENIYSKLGVSTRAGAAVFALQNGLVPPSGPVGGS
jgi:DNA-binding CsgD family transcriptional regulator